MLENKIKENKRDVMFREGGLDGLYFVTSFFVDVVVQGCGGGEVSGGGTHYM